MLDKNAYLNNILEELEDLKKRGRHNLYRINDEISKDTLLLVSNYFIDNPLYEITIKKCVSFENSYDVMVTIL
jgi:hypothetical protein